MSGVLALNLVQIGIPILTALIGFVGGAISRIIYVIYKTRIRRRKLRKSLHAEIKTMDWLEKSDLATIRDKIEERGGVSHTHFPTRIYDTLTEELGLLSDSELEAVISYYSTAHIAKEQLSSLRDGEGDATDFTEGTLNDAIYKRDKAIKELESRMN